MHRPFFLLLLLLAGCSAPQERPALSATKPVAYSALEHSLSTDLDAVLDSAKAAGTPEAAERSAQEAFALRKHPGFTQQFQVQAQRLPSGKIQLQLQAQITGKGLDAQAQRQVQF